MMIHTTDNETLMSVRQAAKYLGVSVVTVWRKLGLGGARRELSCYRFGHRVLLSKEKHLLPYLHAHEQRSEE
jgi:excisionase family DNA binding protein